MDEWVGLNFGAHSEGGDVEMGHWGLAGWGFLCSIEATWSTG